MAINKYYLVRAGHRDHIVRLIMAGGDGRHWYLWTHSGWSQWNHVGRAIYRDTSKEVTYEEAQVFKHNVYVG